MSADDVRGGRPVGEGRVAWRDVLHGPYRSLFLANVTSSLGDWIGVTAVLALTDQIVSGATRGTAFAMAAVLMARVVPTMLLGPVAGVLVDRWDRRRVLVWTDVGRGVVMALVPFSPDMTALLLGTVVIEVMSTLFLPAKDAAIPLLVPRSELVAANQLNLVAAYGTFPVGGALFALVAGASQALFGDVWLFLAERPAAVPIWVNSLTFFASAIFVTRIPRSSLVGPSVGGSPGAAASGEGQGAWDQLMAGMRFIAGHRLVRALVTGVMGAFLAAGAVVSGGQLFATIVNAGDVGFGVLIAVVGTGLFAGILSVGPLSQRFAKEQLFAPGIAIAGVSLVLAALMPRLDLASLWVLLMGYGGGVAFLTAYTILQERTDDRLRGRTFAAFNTGIRAALFVSLLVVPVLIGIIGPEAAGLVADQQQIAGEGPIQAGDITGAVPYRIGGVRISLILAGLVAVAGALYSGRGIRQALANDSDAVDDMSGSSAGTGPQGRVRGLLVTFEGGSDARRTRHILELAQDLQDRGQPTLTDVRPADTALAARLSRSLDEQLISSHRARLLLRAAIYAQFVEERIRPALASGHVVVAGSGTDHVKHWEDDAAPAGQLITDELSPDLHIELPDTLNGHHPAPTQRLGPSKQPTRNPLSKRLVFHPAHDDGDIRSMALSAVMGRLDVDGPSS